MKSLTRFNFLFAMMLALVMVMGVLAACDDDDDDDDDDAGDDDATDDDTTDDDATDDDATDDDDDDDDDDDTAPGNARIRALHLSPNAGIVDIWVDNTLEFVADVDFTEGSTYGEVPAGMYTINIVPDGGDPATDSVFDIPVDLAADTDYTAVVYGEIPISKEDSGLAALLIIDDASAAMDPANFILFVGHTADAAILNPVDVYAILDGSDDLLLIDEFAYGGGEFFELAPASYDIGFDLNEDPSDYDAAFTTPDLPGGAQYNVFAVYDDPDIFLIAQLPDGTTARIDPNM
ncbi:MAG: DUF4397 domain-containing protein [Candidatus Lernaella stagnicola]|nr:DUF4397 domain-containing protein [Candidatus Lernaella stagnicola]